MQLTTKHYYDDETFEHVKSKFYIDGEEVDFEAYMDFIGGLEEYNKDGEELADDNPYEYVDEDEVCECDECKYKDKKKYESCNDDCKYMNCDECCNDFCEDCEGCKVEEFDYGELLEIFTKRIQDTGGCPECIKEILDEFADIFIPDYDEDEFDITEDDIIDESVDECNDCEDKDVCLDVSIIEHFFDKIENLDCNCDSCVKNVLYELFMLGKEIGWNDCEKEFVDDVDNKSDIICNLTLNVNNMSGTKNDINTLASKIINEVKKLSINY